MKLLTGYNICHKVQLSFLEGYADERHALCSEKHGTVNCTNALV